MLEIITPNPIYKIRIKTLDDLGLKPRYKVDRIDSPNLHQYSINDSPTYFVGVSTVLDILNKPFLMPWAAKECALKNARLIKRFRDYAHSLLFKPGVSEVDPRTVYRLFERFLSDEKIDKFTNWGKNAYRRIKDDAADVGTRAHQAIEDITTGKSPVITDDIKLPVEGFLTWLERTHLTIVSGDLKVASVEEEYGGSLDALFMDPKEQLVLGDYKTSNQFADSYVYQTAAYGKAFCETYGYPKLPPSFILRFDKKKPRVEIRGIAFATEAYKAFESLLNTYRLSQINYWDEIQQWDFKPSKLKKTNKKSEETNDTH